MRDTPPNGWESMESMFPTPLSCPSVPAFTLDHLPNKILLRVYCVPSRVLGSGALVMNKTDKIPAFKFLYETNEETEV